ncbi:MAG: hypothetical protein IKE16_06470, partial [Solobacterium sp.]|nr:hypothetical protein [Solobacterium sp.]
MALLGLNMPVIQPTDLIVQDIVFLPQEVQYLTMKFAALSLISPYTQNLTDLYGVFQAKCEDLAVMNGVIAEVKAQYAEEHPGEEIEIYGQLKEAMGVKDPTFLMIEALIEGIELQEDTPIEAFEAAVEATSLMWQGAAVAVDAMIRDAFIPNWITIETISYFRPDILVLAEEMGLDKTNTVGGLRTAISFAIEAIDEGIAKGEKQIEDGIKQLKEAEKQLEEGEKELEEQLAEGQAKIDDGWREIEENRVKLADGEAELKEAEDKIADARRDLDKGRKELADGRIELEDAKTDGLKELNEA